MAIILPYMVRSGAQQHITEPYVSVPPALTIIDEVGAIWTLGFRTGDARDAPRDEFSFNVLRNGRDTGEVASRIERCKGRIRVFTRKGWKWMRSRASDSTMTVFGIGARIKLGPTPLWEAHYIRVSMTFEHQPGPVCCFSFPSQDGGGVEDLGRRPLQCRPGEWLSATIEPAGSDVEVMAYLGHETMRAIPIVNLVTAEDQ